MSAGEPKTQTRLCTDIERVDWLALADVFERAPLGTRDPAMLALSFKNSQVRCFVYADSQIIGAGRALSDGALWTVVFDVVLLPEYQGLGLGRALMDSLIAQAGALNVMLYAAPGKQPFYAKQDFRLMTTAMARFANSEGAKSRGMIV
ncbi:GNAT family N-acetyltransferase [Roseateles oligotrophus]|uniref:GNAT family N-acetyltransferase n=1 Tax=Roseateles oligotrophus TaxID=1769250 RepID=A0ABT2YCZ8_9BURK|nr:GNAT family N-acetyltransferase [Roseateles oligotrophus]MCV2367899.1 GNAT family N-acetyltransferase [Roseateles oligotrophus]